MTMPSDPPPPAPFRRAVVMTQVGMDLLAPTIVGLVVDWQSGTAPWGTIIGLLVGLALCLYHLAWIAKRLKNPDQNGPGQGEP